MSISVIICHKQDQFLKYTLDALFRDTYSSEVEIIVVNDDESDNPLILDEYPYSEVRVIENGTPRGVGYSFDRGVELASNDTIVLMASDVIVKDSLWVEIAENFATNNIASIGCSVCLSGDPTHLDPYYPANEIKRYGATILPYFTTEDLRSDSPLLDQQEYNVGMFENRWIKQRPNIEMAEIPCVYGGLYITNKPWYQRIRGWDTVNGQKFSGHRSWGGLENWLCIKNYLMGGNCYVLTNFETLHIFHKFGTDSWLSTNPNNDQCKFWWNKLFIAYTMLPEHEEDRLVSKVTTIREKYGLYTLQLNEAKKLISNNWAYVQSVRQRNMAEFKHDFDWFCDKFNIERNY